MVLMINPTAGNGRAARVGDEMVEALEKAGVAYEAVYTEYAGHAQTLARAAAEGGVDTVVAVGGDGTVLEVMRGIFGTKAALGIIPAGTGNDVVKMLNIPREPAAALAHLLQTPPRPLDAGRINETLFLNVCGTGFDVVVLEYALSAKRYVRGMLPYLWGVLRTILTYKPVRVTITADDEAPFTQDILLLAIANGRFIGGGMEVAPDAHPDDGLFDVIVVDHMPRWRMPFQLPKFLNGRIRQIPGTRYVRCRRVKMEGAAMRVNVDGEIVPMASAELSILPGGLAAHW